MLHNNKTYLKKSFILILAILFSLLYSLTLLLGVKVLWSGTINNIEEYPALIKINAIQLAEKLTKGEYTDNKELREEDPAIIACQNCFDVYHYDLSLSFDFTKKSLNGKLVLLANSLSDTMNYIFLNFYDNMNISQVSIKKRTNEKISSLNEISEMDDVSFERNNNYIIIKSPYIINRNQEFIVKILYSGTPVKAGFDSFSFKEIYGNMCIYNLSEPNYAPVWWPCKDLPDDKSLSTVRLTVPEGFKGVSNGLMTDSVNHNDGTLTYTWMNSYPIATYLVSIVVSKFSFWQDKYVSLEGSKEMPIVYYVFPKDSLKSLTDWKRTPEMIKLFAETYGEYPFIDEKYGMVQFGWVSGAMEHQTLTSMGYHLLSGDGRYESVVAHELAHQWFGDAVTLASWKDIWLNEGFATYSEAIWEEYKGGKEAYLSYMKNIDFGYFSGTVYAPEGFIDNYAVYSTVYQKGAWVLHMLRGVLGDEVFFKAVREYYNRYKYQNADTKQLQAVFEEIYGHDLQWFFDQWVYTGTGRPKYEYSWKFEDFMEQPTSGAYTIRLQLKQVQTDRDVYKMPVKVTIISADGDKEFTVFNDQREQSFVLTTDINPKEIRIDKDGWILKKIAKGKY
jgi:aminopeptidase N